MENSIDKANHLKKIISIPISILKDLKHLAINADKTLKVYIQDLLVDEVTRFREKNR